MSIPLPVAIDVKTAVRMAIYALLVLVVLGFATSWYLRGGTIDRLRDENAALEVRAANTQRLLDQAREASARLGERLQEREAAQAGIGRVREGINRAPPQSDSAVAPVLRDALGELGRLRQPAGTPANRPGSPGPASDLP
jgi:hypothetical protein